MQEAGHKLLYGLADTARWLGSDTQCMIQTAVYPISTSRTCHTLLPSQAVSKDG